MCLIYDVLSHFMLFCCKIVIYTVLSRYLFCRDLRTFAWRKNQPRITPRGEKMTNMRYVYSNHLPKESDGIGVYAYTARELEAGLVAPGQAGVYFVYFIPLPVTHHPCRWCILSSPVTSQVSLPPLPPTGGF